MFRRMLIKDVRRNLTVTITLVVLMTLSVVLATASTGLLAALTGASGRLLAEADAPDVAQMHAGPLDPAEVDAWANARDDVRAHQVQTLVGVDNAHLSFDGVTQEGSVQQNSFVVPNAHRDLFLDLDGDPVTDVAPGTVWLPVIYHVEDGLEPGATVEVSLRGFTKNLTVAGFVRDAIMNTGIASSKRIAAHAADVAEIRAHGGTPEYLLAFWLDDPTQLGAFQKAYLDAGLPSIGPMVDSGAFNLFNMFSEGLVAGVVILASVLLLIVGLLVMRLAFLAAVQNDRREIGVLTAIGVAPGGIRRMYLVKYGAFGAAAVVLGLLGGWALAPVMSRSMVLYLGPAEGLSAWAAPAVVAAVLFGVILLFVHGLLRRIGRASAVESLRAGTVGTGGASPLRLHRSPLPTGITMGLMDLARRPLMYLLLLFVFIVSSFIVVVPASAATTLRSPDFVTNMGVGDADAALNLQYVDATTTEQFDDAVATLAADPDVAEFAALTTTRHDLATADGETVSLYVANGDHQSLPVTYAEGRAPTHDGEIAISLLAQAEGGFTVGDSITLTVDDTPRRLVVVGGYQDLTNGGKTARALLPTDGAEIMWYSLAVTFVEGADVDARLAGFAQEWPGMRPWKMADFQDQLLGPVTRQITQAALISAGVAVALAVLMTAMFTRMLLAGDSSQIAIQRAIGTPDDGIRSQYLTRILVVLALGIPAGIALALTAGQSLFNLLFEGMFGGLNALFQGVSRIEFITNPWLTAVALPAALLVSVGLATVAATRTIHTARVSSLVTE